MHWFTLFYLIFFLNPICEIPIFERREGAPSASKEIQFHLAGPRGHIGGARWRRQRTHHQRPDLPIKISFDFIYFAAER